MHKQKAFAVLCRVIIMAFFTSVMLCAAKPASANNLGYPWYGAEALNEATFDWGFSTCPANNTGCKLFKDTKNGVVYGEADPWGYYLRNCTSYAAWKLTSLGVPTDRVRGLGNGGEWAENARNKGISVDSNPAVGDVAVVVAGTPGYPYGHVAYVEAVYANGTIMVSEYNFDLHGNAHTRTGLPAAMKFTRFAHFGPLMTTPPASSGTSTVPSADVYLVQHWNSPSGMTEVKKIAVDANPPYSSWDGGWTTQDGWHGGADVVYGMADYNGDGKQDVYKVQHANTNSGMTELQIMDGSNGYRWVGGWVTADGLHSTNDVSYAIADYNNDKKPDLFKIQHWNSPTGKIEVQIMDGANGWRLFGGWATPEGWHGGDDVDYVLSSCGAASGDRPNLYQILHQNTPSGMTEVKVFNGSANYTTMAGGWSTADGAHSGNDTSYGVAGCNSNGKPNLYVILHNNTNDGQAQVKGLDGAQNWGQWKGGWSTPDGVHSGNDVDYVLPLS